MLQTKYSEFLWPENETQQEQKESVQSISLGVTDQKTALFAFATFALLGIFQTIVVAGHNDYLGSTIWLVMTGLAVFLAIYSQKASTPSLQRMGYAMSLVVIVGFALETAFNGSLAVHTIVVLPFAFYLVNPVRRAFWFSVAMPVAVLLTAYAVGSHPIALSNIIRLAVASVIVLAVVHFSFCNFSYFQRAIRQKTTNRQQFFNALNLEIRSPLHSLEMLGDLLDEYDSLRQEPNTELVNMLELTRAHCALTDQLVALVSLALRNFETGTGHTAEVASVRTKELALELASMAKTSLYQNGITMNVAIDEHLPQAIRTDGVRVQQVLLAMIHQACLQPSSGVITLFMQLYSESVDPKSNGLGVRFGLIDRRLKVSEWTMSLLSNIKDNPDEVDSESLHLQLANQLCNFLDSQIQSCSSEGGGHCIWFELPLQCEGSRAIGSLSACTLAQMQNVPKESSGTPDADAKADPVKPEPAPCKPAVAAKDLINHKVLLIDDDRMLLRLHSTLLERSGALCIKANNGAKALTLAAEHSDINCFLLDYQLPDYTGDEVAVFIRALDHHRHTPIVVLSGGVLETEKAQLLAAGVNQILHKPIDPASLIQTLADCTNHSNRLNYSSPKPQLTKNTELLGAIR